MSTSKKKTDHNTFTVTTLNANGLRSAADKGFLRWLKKRQPDVLCMQELRAHPDQVPDQLQLDSGEVCRDPESDRNEIQEDNETEEHQEDDHQSGGGYQ